ncbi:MAG TPA: TetR/AcrR family transcriptional regulator [Desulfotignum sp.]|jgi:AcrR family transcriptional regulator|nr:TetR/AcrR family transcriptional regulator [Desulfotignum sp.]
MPARKTDTEQRQDQIVQAALDLINDSGITGLSIAGIAQRVGIVPSALYRHFSSKDAVLDAVLNLIETRLLANVSYAGKLASGPLEQLRLLFRRHIAMLNENQAIPHVVFSDAVYTGDPGRKARIARTIATYLKEVEAIIARGKEDGSIRMDVVPATAAVMFLGMIMPAAVLWNISEKKFDIAFHVKTAWPMFEHAVAVK